MAGERVLILEDDPLLHSVLAERLRREGLDVCSASNLAEARRALEEHEPDVALCDLRLPDGNGVDLIREAAGGGATVFAVMAAHASLGSGMDAMALGATDCIEKPFTLERAVAAVRQALAFAALRHEVALHRDRASLAGAAMVTESPAMRHTLEIVERLAAADAAMVLVEGESGAGKGCVARALHRMSRRAGGPFLELEVCGRSEASVESELLGGDRGAHADAGSRRRGLLEMADGGTLFVHDVADLSPGTQAKLQRFAEERAFRRVGGTADRTADVCVVAATCRDLGSEVAAGRFFADLYYRLRVIPVVVPPLRERREDIAPLARQLLARFARETACRVAEIADDALAALSGYDWPGNVRELRGVVERSALRALGPAITAGDLPAEVAGAALAGQSERPRSEAQASGTLGEAERRLLVAALEKWHGNQSRAAVALGISRHQIRTRMRRHGLLGAALLILGALGAPLRAQQPAAAPQCERCHGSREFLASAGGARLVSGSLVVSAATLENSVHAGVACVSCHPRARVFPHRADAGLEAPCGTCHASADSTWHTGVHAAVRGSARVTCKSCHGSHEIRPVESAASPEGRAAVDRTCAQCHRDMAFRAGDVHADSVSCVGCHGAHGMRPLSDPGTRGLALTVAERCGRCHRAEAESFWQDTHGTLALRQAAASSPLGPDTSATCVSCHLGHSVRVPADRVAHFAFAAACTRCHGDYAAGFRETYHGQATRVGSEDAALCADCHAPHAIYPASDARSSVSASKRLETCRRCHPDASPRFAAYQPHANPRDAARFPGLHAVWLALTCLFGAVTAVYLAHAALVSRRLLLERRRQA